MTFEMSDREIVEKDIEALYLGNLNTVEFDLDLPSRGKYGSTINWESKDERFITPEGTSNTSILRERRSCHTSHRQVYVRQCKPV
ncbi:UNVERIFIED_ORG: hypothetical protein ABRZ91_001221 [Heyndrickxia coagulans]